MPIIPTKWSEANFSEIINEDTDSISDNFIDYLIRYHKILWFQIPYEYKYRIDLIAKFLYGNTKFYWILMRLNTIMHVEELAERRLLRYATLTDMESAYLSWKNSEHDTNSN
jgi:hypothetical protein